MFYKYFWYEICIVVHSWRLLQFFFRVIAKKHQCSLAALDWLNKNHWSYFFYEYLHKRINVCMHKCESTHASIYIYIYTYIYILYLYIYTYAYMYTCTCKHVMYVYIMCAYLLYIKCLFLLLCESSVCRMRRKRKIDRTNNQTNYR